MLVLGLANAKRTTDAEEAVITTPEGQTIVIRFLGWSSKYHQGKIGIEAARDIVVTRRLIHPEILIQEAKGT